MADKHYKVLVIYVLILSCNFKRSYEKKDRLTMNPIEHVIVANNTGELLFVFDKNLGMGDGTALLLDSSGNVLYDFKDRKLKNLIVSAKFFDDRSLVLSLEKNFFLLFDVTTKKTYYSRGLNSATEFFSSDEFFLLNDSTLVYANGSTFGGGNYGGLNVMKLDLKKDRNEIVQTNVDALYENSGRIYFTKFFNEVWQVVNGGDFDCVVRKGVKGCCLVGNYQYNAKLSWSGLSRELELLLDKHLSDYTDRIFEYQKIVNYRYDNNYMFEVYISRTGERVLQETFPQSGFDVQSIDFLNDNFLIMNMFERSEPAEHVMRVYDIVHGSFHSLPRGVLSVGCVGDCLVLVGERLYIYDLKTLKIKDVCDAGDISEAFVSKGGSDAFFYATKNYGNGYDIMKLDVKYEALKKVRRIDDKF